MKDGIANDVFRVLAWARVVGIEGQLFCGTTEETWKLNGTFLHRACHVSKGAFHRTEDEARAAQAFIRHSREGIVAHEAVHFRPGFEELFIAGEGDFGRLNLRRK